IQEAAHEEANIIFGAVIDETLKDGELRVTVIATGLDGGRDGRSPRWDGTDPIARTGRFDHEAPGSAPMPMAQPAPPPAASPFAEAPPAATAASPEEMTGDFISPFEDELDVPAFLRRR
ncbi:MAG TPA: cell division protein FtsZ, partial [Myxococcota bacterium]|nr:cell division protein FtsZ [Myxococcota bacterium]